MEEAILAQESGTVPLPEDYTQFIPKVRVACHLADGLMMPGG